MAKSLMPDVRSVARNALNKVTGGYASEDEKEDKEKGRAVAKQKTGPESARRKAQTSREAARKEAHQKKENLKKRRKSPSGPPHQNVPARTALAKDKSGKELHGTADSKRFSKSGRDHGTAPTSKKTAHGTVESKSVKGGGKGGGPKFPLKK